MKKIISTLLCILMLIFCMTACQKAQPTQDGTEEVPAVETQNETKSEAPADEGDPDYAKDFTVSDVIYTENSEGVICKAKIRLPELASVSTGAGKLVENSNDTMILMGGQFLDTELTTNEVDKVLNDFFHDAIDSLRMFRHYDYSNYAFSISTAEPVTINGYSMCKYTGTHTYTYMNDPETINYVAYTTQLKGNGAFAYWIVLDESKDQSQSALIEEYATKIANTLSE